MGGTRYRRDRISLDAHAKNDMYEFKICPDVYPALHVSYVFYQSSYSQVRISILNAPVLQIYNNWKLSPPLSSLNAANHQSSKPDK